MVWLWTFGSRTAWLVNKSAGQAPVLGTWLSQPGQISLLTGIETGWPQTFLICWRGCHVYPHLDWAPALLMLKFVECSNCIGNKAVLALLACSLVPSRQYSWSLLAILVSLCAVTIGQAISLLEQELSSSYNNCLWSWLWRLPLQSQRTRNQNLTVPSTIFNIRLNAESSECSNVEYVCVSALSMLKVLEYIYILIVTYVVLFKGSSLDDLPCFIFNWFMYFILMTKIERSFLRFNRINKAIYRWI